MTNSRIDRCLASAVAIALALMCAPAAGCGACDEDKVAATYDHALVSRAAARHDVIVFAAIEGTGNARVLARDVKAAAARVPGIDRASIRTAAEPLALFFAVDPKVATPEVALAAIEKRMPVSHVKLPVLRIGQ